MRNFWLKKDFIPTCITASFHKIVKIGKKEWQNDWKFCIILSVILYGGMTDV